MALVANLQGFCGANNKYHMNTLCVNNNKLVIDSDILFCQLHPLSIVSGGGCSHCNFLQHEPCNSYYQHFSFAIIIIITCRQQEGCSCMLL